MVSQFIASTRPTTTGTKSRPRPRGRTFFSIGGTACSGDQLTVVVAPGGQALGTYRANIQVVADDPEVEDGDQAIQVTLRVVTQVYSAHLPIVIGSGP